MGYAFRTTMEKLIDGMYHYPAKQGQTRYSLSKDMMTHMTQIEYKSVVESEILG